MACEGCQIEIAVASGSDPDVVYGDFQREAEKGWEGKCGESVEGAGDCVPKEACVFGGWVNVSCPPVPEDENVQWTAKARSLRTPVPETVEQTKPGDPGGTFFNLYLQGQGGTPNTSLCEGLKNPPEQTNGYEITVKKDGVVVSTAYLYCGLCTE